MSGRLGTHRRDQRSDSTTGTGSRDPLNSLLGRSEVRGRPVPEPPYPLESSLLLRRVGSFSSLLSPTVEELHLSFSPPSPRPSPFGRPSPLCVSLTFFLLSRQSRFVVSPSSFCFRPTSFRGPSLWVSVLLSLFRFSSEDGWRLFQIVLGYLGGPHPSLPGVLIDRRTPLPVNDNVNVCKFSCPFRHDP